MGGGRRREGGERGGEGVSEREKGIVCEREKERLCEDTRYAYPRR